MSSMEVMQAKLVERQVMSGRLVAGRVVLMLWQDKLMVMVGCLQQQIQMLVESRK
jgi:hypothetical protein